MSRPHTPAPGNLGTPPPIVERTPHRLMDIASPEALARVYVAAYTARTASHIPNPGFHAQEAVHRFCAVIQEVIVHD